MNFIKKHTKAMLGSFTLALVVISISCSNDDGYFKESVVNSNLLPEASFTSSEVVVDYRKNVTFTSTSTKSPSLYSWSFPGGTPTSSIEPNPTVFYGEGGTFDVTLKVRNKDGAGETIVNDVVTIIKPEVELLDKTAWEIIDFSSEASSTRLVSNVIDGDYVTAWWADFSITTYPHSFTVDMKEARVLESVTLHRGGSGYYSAKTHEIWTSTDNINWILVVSGDAVIRNVELGVGVSMGIKTIPFPTARYVKYVAVKHLVSGRYFALGELDIYAFVE